MSWWVDLLVALGVGLVVAWLGLIVVLLVFRPSRAVLGQAARLLPHGVRIRLWLLLGYLASPVDLVPDFIPIIGYADDAIVVVAVLRSVVRRAGREPLHRHWPDAPDGLAAVERLSGLTVPSTREGPR